MDEKKDNQLMDWLDIKPTAISLTGTHVRGPTDLVVSWGYFHPDIRYITS